MDDYSAEERNFLILIQALKYSTVGLKTHVDHCMDNAYKRLKRKLSSTTVCTQSCSKHFTDRKQWCRTCVQWKDEIEKLMRFPSHRNRVKWQDIDVSLLSGNDPAKARVELCRIYVRDAGTFKYDIQTMLSILQNCRYFLVGDNIRLLESVRKVRNIDFAHTEDFVISKRRLKKSIRTLIHFFQHPSHKTYEWALITVNKLKALEANENQSLVDIEACRVFESITDICIADVDEFLSIPEPETRIRSFPKRNLLLIGLSLTILALLITFRLYMITVLISSYLDEAKCKNATYEYPFTLEIDMDFYRSQHKKLIGREWLLNELDETMHFSRRGVLFIAEMGYGKSALVSHLICQSDKRLPGNWIYERIVVYHLCNFDSRKTLSPGNFVKNLAGGFAKRVPGFFKVLKQSSNFHKYFEQDLCTDDPEGCLDFLILKTLNAIGDLDKDENQYIVVIDGLDECFDYGNRNIFYILWRRLQKFPVSFKFLITSRNISQIQIAKTQLNVFEKSSLDPKNSKDAEKYINEQLKGWSLSNQNHFTDVFKASNLQNSIRRAVQYTKGNMLLLSKALPTWLEENISLQGSFTTFEILFNDQLNRIFQDRRMFRTVRKIFQVLCCAVEPMSEDELLKVAGIGQEETVEVMRILGKELSHFIRQYEGKISFVHKSLALYLTDTKRRTEDFYILKKDGCTLFAKYYLNILDRQKSFSKVSILYLVEYVSCSEDQNMKLKFLEQGKKYVKKFARHKHILHEAAVKFNSYSVMTLLLDLIASRNVDEIDSGNVTASYVAAAYGNHQTLKALLERNANVNFVRLGPRFINESVDMLEFCKTLAFWEYSLLNIASQNGHLKTVQTLLTSGADLMHQTAFGSNSFHLAVENGHIHVVREFLLRYKSKFSASLNHSLYLAAANGHSDIVDLLLYHGAIDSCLPCNSSQYWTLYHQTRLQVIDNIDDLRTVNYIFKDDRRLVRCETALEIAVQNGYKEIVQRLINQPFNTFNCREAGGRTPTFTAIKFHRPDLFELVYSKGISKSSRCLYRRNRIEKLDLHKSERKQYIDNLCPYNITPSHFLAYHWNKEIFNIGLLHSLWNWTDRDSRGATPLHYACCKGNIEMIDSLKNLGAAFDMIAFNGSTPLHSAAICNQYDVLNYLFSLYPKPPPDNENKYVCHYLASGGKHYNESTKLVITISNIYHLSTLRNLLQDEGLFKDVFNRIPLHYACANGNVNFVSLYIKLKLPTNFWSKVFDILDVNGDNIIEMAFKHTPILYQENIKTVENCNIYLLTDDSNCEDYRLEIFIPHEYMIYVILKNMPKSRQLVKRSIGKYVNYSLQKNNANLLGILYFNFPFEFSEYTYREGIESMKHLLTHHHINPMIFAFLKQMRYRCSQNSVLHEIVQDENRIFWITYFFNFTQMFQIVPDSLDLCFDEKGYNLLHRSIMGGNFVAFTILRNLGMSLTTETRDGKNSLEVLVENSPCFKEEFKRRELVITIYDSGNSKKERLVNNLNLYVYDFIALSITRETDILMNMKPYDVCSHRNEISFVHVVAAKALYPILKEVERLFGSSIALCVNSHGFQSTEFMLFYNHLPWRSITPLKNKTNFMTLFLKTLLDFRPFFSPKDSIERKCRYRIRNNRNFHGILSCATQMETEFLLFFRQLVKKEGRKSVNDLQNAMDGSYVHDKKKHKEFFSANFGRNLKAALSMEKNPREFQGRYFCPIRGLNRSLTAFSCLNVSKVFDRDTSLKCLCMISFAGKTKKNYKSIYEIARMSRMFSIFHLYEKDLNFPYSKYRDSLISPYFDTVVMYSMHHPEYHMEKRYRSLEKMKTCRNKLAKEMIKTITLSKIKEIQKWQGFYEGDLFLRPKNDLKDADAPLKTYDAIDDYMEVY
ncbi:uncharacterized protein LOC134269602 [Saccostrea cucullata]|uniref:uncharacterized protein LOC134269602 n=1 Tax=Saccostrea cuccullata TaxID=36930 RepID=UPI002ED24BEA